MIKRILLHLLLRLLRLLRQVTVKNSVNVPLLGLARIKWVEELLEDCMEMIYVPASFSSLSILASTDAMRCGLPMA